MKTTVCCTDDFFSRIQKSWTQWSHKNTWGRNQTFLGNLSQDVDRQLLPVFSAQVCLDAFKEALDCYSQWWIRIIHHKPFSCDVYFERFKEEKETKRGVRDKEICFQRKTVIVLKQWLRQFFQKSSTSFPGLQFVTIDCECITHGTLSCNLWTVITRETRRNWRHYFSMNTHLKTDTIIQSLKRDTKRASREGSEREERIRRRKRLSKTDTQWVCLRWALHLTFFWTRGKVGHTHSSLFMHKNHWSHNEWVRK